MTYESMKRAAKALQNMKPGELSSALLGLFKDFDRKDQYKRA